ERIAHLRSVVEDQLAAQLDDARLPDRLHRQHRILAQPVPLGQLPSRFARSWTCARSGVVAALWRRGIRPPAATVCKRSCMDVAAVARRARTENFPVASLLFPRRLRPHLRAVYGFARLVDILGDEVEGDRLAALDELERELDACYGGEPAWPVMRALKPTITEFSLPREPFLRLIEANRMDQRTSEYATWDDLR